MGQLSPQIICRYLRNMKFTGLQHIRALLRHNINNNMLIMLLETVKLNTGTTLPRPLLTGGSAHLDIKTQIIFAL